MSDYPSRAAAIPYLGRVTTSEDSAALDAPVDEMPTLRERLGGKHAGTPRADSLHPDDRPVFVPRARHADEGATEKGYLRLYPDAEYDLDPEEERPPTAAERAAADGRTLPGYSVTFKQRRGTRRFLALQLLVFLSATGVTTYTAARDHTSSARIVAVTLALTTALVWAAWAATAVARLSIIGGMLEVEQDGAKHIIALTSPYTEIESRYRPGDPRWKLIFRRLGHAGVVVDSSMVNPKKFMTVLRAYRPEV